MPALVPLIVLFGIQSPSLGDVLARMDDPKEGDLQVIRAAGEKAFEVLYPMVVARIKSLKNPAAPEIAEKRLASAVSYLCECAPARQTTKLLALYDGADERTQSSLVVWMARNGEPNAIAPLFGRLLKNAAEGSNSMLSDEVVTGLMRRHQGNENDRLLSKLLDKKTNSALRAAIFKQICGTGDPRILAAVDRLRAGPETIPTAQHRAPFVANEWQPGVQIKSAWKDPRGATWVLGCWDGLGSPEDLWIFKRTPRGLGEPLFTGVSNYWPLSMPTGTATRGKEAHEAEMRRFIEGGGWHGRLLTSGALERDSDSDGYTDVEERWLGLDPTNPDTDDDGIQDGVDKNPAAPRRKMGDIELALTAAFDAAELMEPIQRTIYVQIPPSVKPFELVAWRGLVLPFESKLPRTRPGALYGNWIRTGSKAGPPVIFSHDRKSAQVEVQIAGGWYETTYLVSVRKMGGKWYPVGSRLTFSAVS